MTTLKKIFITGGAGYVGSVLVDMLLKEGFEVTVLDLMIYGDTLKKEKNLKVIKGDIRDQKLLKQYLIGQDVVIHLACISNDPSFELNPNLGKSINYDAFEPLVSLSKQSMVKKFIYASSSSVYGIKEEKSVVEEMNLSPLTDYSKYKAECEEIITKYEDKDFTTVIMRPATVCGFSRRQRLDVIVNILTNLAFHKREISVFGGSQFRPNIHIDDMCRAYLEIIAAPVEKIAGQVFNVGSKNQSVLEIAEIVKSVVGEDVKLVKTPTNDPRSYHISSEKIYRTIGFKPEKSIKIAAEDLVAAFEKKVFVDPLKNEMYFNIKRMQSIRLT